MVLEVAACWFLAAGNTVVIYRCIFARQNYAWKLETAEDVQAVVPPSFRCPISQEVMREPVVTADGQTYERCNIEEWFRRGYVTSPLTNLSLPSKELVPNLALQQAVADFDTKVCPLLREEVQKRRRLERRVEDLLQREATSQKETEASTANREEAVRALTESLNEREAEMVALRKIRDEAMQARNAALNRQREEFDQELELALAASELSFKESKAEADELRCRLNNAMRIIHRLRRPNHYTVAPSWHNAPRAHEPNVVEATPPPASADEVGMDDLEEIVLCEPDTAAPGGGTAVAVRSSMSANPSSPEAQMVEEETEEVPNSPEEDGRALSTKPVRRGVRSREGTPIPGRPPSRSRIRGWRNLFRMPSGPNGSAKAAADQRDC